MKTKTLALVLLALFVVSSLEAVWADEVFDSEEFEESKDVSVNDFSEIEEDEFDILTKVSCKGKKVKSHNHESGKCLPSECKKTCKVDEYKSGKCVASEKSDKVKKCYCIKSCHKKHKKDKKHKKKDPPNPPSSSPAFPPTDVPSFVIPDLPPTIAPSPNTQDLPIVDFPDLPPTTAVAAPMSYTSLEDDDSNVSDIVY